MFFTSRDADVNVLALSDIKVAGNPNRLTIFESFSRTMVINLNSNNNSRAWDDKMHLCSAEYNLRRVEVPISTKFQPINMLRIYRSRVVVIKSVDTK
jgi:hypothetical protein